jgi:hypothetical protein
LGLYVYLSTPRQLAANSDGRSRSALFAELFDLDRKGRDLAKGCDPGVNIAVKSSIERTSIGGGVWRQLLAVDHSLFMRADSVADAGAAALVSNADQQGVIDQVAQRVPPPGGAAPDSTRYSTARVAAPLALHPRSTDLRAARRADRAHHEHVHVLVASWMCC